MKIKRRLPTCINFTTPELALACAHALEEHRDIDNNLHPPHVFEGMMNQSGIVRLSIDDESVMWGGSGQAFSAPTVSSMPEFLKLIEADPNEEEPIIIEDDDGDEHEVEFETDGIRVGCNFASWETLDRIMKHRPGKYEVHNPNNYVLSAQEIAGGYRLIDKDEIRVGDDLKIVSGLECRQTCNATWTRSNKGNSRDATYRTKLTREQLAEQRK